MQGVVGIYMDVKGNILASVGMYSGMYEGSREM